VNKVAIHPHPCGENLIPLYIRPAAAGFLPPGSAYDAYFFAKMRRVLGIRAFCWKGKNRLSTNAQAVDKFGCGLIFSQKPELFRFWGLFIHR
jgi:hypothetical protein